MLPVIAIRNKQYLMNKSNNGGFKQGPSYKDSFKLLLLSHLALQSKTMRKCVDK